MENTSLNHNGVPVVDHLHIFTCQQVFSRFDSCITAEDHDHPAVHFVFTLKIYLQYCTVLVVSVHVPPGVNTVLIHTQHGLRWEP